MMKTSLMERILTLREKTNQKYVPILESVMRGDYRAKVVITGGLVPEGREGVPSDLRDEMNRLFAHLEEKTTNLPPRAPGLRLIRSSQ